MKCAWPRCRQLDDLTGYHRRELCDRHLSLPTASLHETLGLAPVDGCLCTACNPGDAT